MRSYDVVRLELTDLVSTNAVSERQERPMRIIAEMLLDIREVLGGILLATTLHNAEEEQAAPKKKQPVPPSKDPA